MKRLVYSPYVQAFIKSDDGVIDVSPYITAGSVDRKVNQVSSAQLTLRNPVQGDSSRMLFTEYSAHGEDPHPMFHPMDPIVIVLQRIAGHPVQVFTGYLDSAPYFQLFPGLCSLSASCTLKRLLYTQWDSSLVSVQQFLTNFGWEPNGSGVWNLSADQARIDTNKPKSQLNDGSIGALLFAVMNVIGAWDESTIWIEALPPQIKDIVTKLYQQIEPEVQGGEVVFQSFLTEILGTASHGSGGPGVTGGGSGAIDGGLITAAAAKKLHLTLAGTSLSAENIEVANIALDACARHKADAVVSIAIIYAGMGEHGLSLDDTWQNSTDMSTADEAESWLLGGNGFQQGGGIACAKNNPSYASWQVANAVESNASWLGRDGNPPGSDSYALHALSSVGQSGGLAEAAAIVAAYNAAASSATGSGSAGGNLGVNAPNASTAPAATSSAVDSGDASTATLAGNSPGGKTGNPAAAGNSSAVTNLAGVATIANQAYQRQKTSGCFNYPPGDVRPSGGIQYDLLTGASVTDDCSGFAIACYKLAGLPDPSHNNYNGSGYTGDMITHCTKVAQADALPGDLCFFGSSEATTDHVNVYVGGGDSVSLGQQGEPGKGPAAEMGPSGFLGFYRSDVSGAASTGVASGSTGSTGSGSAIAAAFSTMLDLPGALTNAEADILTGKRSFIADSPLFPFVDQLAQASMRNYMSMPNGNFFAFFPDYFGFFGRQYYWEIRDIEILDGQINLSDDPLLTHMGVAGDVLLQGEVTLTDLYLTSGIFDIFDAFTTGYVGEGTGTDPGFGQISANPVQKELTRESALAFLQRYGARPFVEEVPAIRSPYYELFLAFQNFMLAWSRQFSSTFEFTFMPELFPGGLIALPDHHIQLYVEEVVHNFDYEQGFTTTATLSSPSTLPNDSKSRKNLSSGLARPAALTTPPTVGGHKPVSEGAQH